jgi:hypothetical protein
MPRAVFGTCTLNAAVPAGVTPVALARTVVPARSVPAAWVIWAAATWDAALCPCPAVLAHARAIRHAPEEGLRDREILAVDTESLLNRTHHFFGVMDGEREARDVRETQFIHVSRDVPGVQLQ